MSNVLGVPRSDWLVSWGTRLCVVVVLLACPILAASALFWWTIPISAVDAMGTMRTLEPPSFDEAVFLEWKELSSRMARGRSLADLLALLPARAPLVRAEGVDGFGRLTTGAEQVISEANDRLSEEQLSDDQVRALRTSLTDLARLDQGSLPVQYAVANFELRYGSKRDAYRLISLYLSGLRSDVTLAALPPSVAVKQGVRPSRAAALVLARYLAGLAALHSGEAVQAIGHLKTAIGNTNYLPAVNQEANARNFRDVPVLSGADAGIAPSDGSTLTSLALYDTLVVSYLLGEGYRDAPSPRGREFGRSSLEHSRDDPFYRLTQASVPWPEATWSRAPVTSAAFGMPEHFVWAFSNLQRVRLANELAIPVRHLAIESAALFHVAALESWPGRQDGSVSKEFLETNAKTRLMEAWRATDVMNPEHLRVARVLLRWSGALDDSDLQMLSADRIRRMLQAMLADDQSDGRLGSLRATATLRARLESRDTRVWSEIEAVEAGAQASLQPLASEFLEESDRSWLAFWRAKALAAYVPAILTEATKHQQRGDPRADDLMKLFDWVAARSGISRAEAISTHAAAAWPATSWWQVKKAVLRDSRFLTIAGVMLVGVLVSVAIWAVFLTVCRYRALLRVGFYRQGLP